MAWAQWTLVVLAAIALLTGANAHGKPNNGTQSFWVTLVAVAIQYALIYFAGGFDNL